MSAQLPTADTYQRYKIGTKTFVQWLAAAARATGKVEHIFASGNTQKEVPATSGRLKGKARKQARQEKSGLNATGSHSTTPKYQVPLKAFTQLAKAVGAAHNVLVPNSMLTILSDVIRTRKEFLSWFTANQSNNVKTGDCENDRHRYFISVLGEVLRLLTVKDTLCTDHQSDEKDQPTVLTNIYECLEVQQTAEMDVISTASSGDGPTQSSTTYVPDAQTEIEDDDGSFAIYCLLKDATDIRIFVRRTWREFKRGELTLIASASVMNAAIASIQRLNLQFLEKYPQFETHEHLIMHVADNCDDTDEDSGGPALYQENGQQLSALDVLCVHNADLLTEFIVLHEGRPCHNAQGDTRLTGDEVVLVKCLAQLAVLVDASDHVYLFNDLVTMAVYTIMYERRLYTWTVFAVQIFWDTLRELEAKSELGLHTLRKFGDWIGAGYDEYFELKDADKIGGFHRVNRECLLKQQATVKKYAKEDYVQCVVDTTEGIIHGQYTFGNCFLLRKHPALCGLIAQRHAMHFHEVSTAAAGTQGMITSAAHLYNAAHQSGLLPHDVKWPDMDHVIQKQGSDWIFVGQRPKQGLEFKTQFHLAFGMGIHKFAKDYNSDRAKIDSKRSWKKRGTNRKLRNHARQVEVLVQRRAKDARQMALTRAIDDPMAYVGEIVANFLHEKAGLERQAMTGMTSVEILQQYKLAIQADNIALKFNIMSLYLRCIALLQRIHRYCLEHAPYDYVKEEFDRDALDMNQILSHIFLDLAGVLRHHKPMFPKAVEFLRETIEKYGDRELELAKSRLLDVRIQDQSDREEHEPSFKNPQEDSIFLEIRAMFGMIIISDENMNCRMPFRYRG